MNSWNSCYTGGIQSRTLSLPLFYKLLVVYIISLSYHHSPLCNYTCTFCVAIGLCWLTFMCEVLAVIIGTATVCIYCIPTLGTDDGC